MATTTTQTLNAYARLMRIDRPEGTLLLLWPTLAALFAAANGLPPLPILVVFVLGTVLMRSAGCVMNDLADRSFDGGVERTRGRPLVTGELTPGDAKILTVILLGLAALLLLFLSPLTQLLAVGGVIVAATYPFMKRYTYLPQAVLGIAFSWGLIMAFAELKGGIPNTAWLLFVASVLWIVAYDTLYAMVDREDDLKVGVKSTAILFGQHDRLIVGVLQASAVFALLLFGQRMGYGFFYGVALLAIACLFTYHQYLIRRRHRHLCFKAFKHNTWVGFALFLGVLAEVLTKPWTRGIG